jgi:hypothetical protein
VARAEWFAAKLRGTDERIAAAFVARANSDLSLGATGHGSTVTEKKSTGPTCKKGQLVLELYLSAGGIESPKLGSASLGNIAIRPLEPAKDDAEIMLVPASWS